MSILAGVMSRNRAPIAADVESAMRTSLSRNPAHQVVEHRTAGLYLCKVDIGAFGSPATRVVVNGGATMLAGHPVLAGISGPRAAHVDALHDALARGDWAIVDKARGTYCAVHYDATSHTLSLIGDKLGVRPIYYYVSREFVFFASALRVLEALTAVPKVVDLRGLTELIVFGYALGRRTAYAEIAVLFSGEVVHVNATSASKRTYWAWDQRVTAVRTPESPRRLHELFARAVEDRLEGDRRTLAFLSGGLDSRCIVSELRRVGTAVHSFNFNRSPTTQEAVLARDIAAALGTDHHSLPVPDHRLDWQEPMFEAMGTIGASDATVERPRLAWSGDGGSVGPGLVYVDKDIVRCMRAGKEREALDIYVGRFGSGIPRRLFAKAVRSSIEALPFEGALAEFAGFSAVEPGRRFHLFLLMNDQRRHLAHHFENVDLRGVDLLLPFFDADFMTAVLTVPLDESIGHALYHRMLEEFSPPTRSVPWQTYPGHVPCPLPIPANLAGQWDSGSLDSWRRALKHARLASLRRIVRSKEFPSQILSRIALVGYTVAYRLGVADYGWVSGVADTVQRYWSRGAGSYVTSPLQRE